MQKDQDKIVIYKNFDKELFALLENIQVTSYGIIQFGHKDIEEINVKHGRPYQVMTIRESVLLGDNKAKNSDDYGD